MRHYSIIFNTTAGRRRSIRVNNPNTNLPLPEISAAVEQILEIDVFDPQAGGLKNLNRMELSVLERTVIFE